MRFGSAWQLASAAKVGRCGREDRAARISTAGNIKMIGVPIKSRNSIDGWDSILSILQMPAGVPVGTVALNGGKNAGILAAQIIGAKDKKVSASLEKYKAGLSRKVVAAAKKLEAEGPKGNKIGFKS